MGRDRCSPGRMIEDHQLPSLGVTHLDTDFTTHEHGARVIPHPMGIG